MNFEIKRTISKLHPSLPGHFPGNPVVPGVVILDEVISAVRHWQSEIELQGINTVKFLSPLLPDEEFCIQLHMPEKGKMKFQCSVADRKLAMGQFKVKENNVSSICKSESLSSESKNE